MRIFYLVVAAAGSSADEWDLIDVPIDDWEVTGADGRDTDPYRAKTTELGFAAVDEFENPPYVISQYDEGTLSTSWMGNHAYVTVGKIVKEGVDPRVADEKLWGHYGGPALLRRVQERPNLGMYVFRLGAALDLEGVDTRTDLSWACETADLKTLMKNEWKHYLDFDWKWRQLSVGSPAEFREAVVRNAFAANVPEECVSVFGINLVRAHRLYRNALSESLGKTVPLANLASEKELELPEVLDHIVRADSLAVKLGNIGINNKIISYAWLAWLVRRSLYASEGLFQWCNDGQLCIRETLGDEKLGHARAMGRVFALRMIHGFGFGVDFPRHYLECLTGRAGCDNKFLSAIREGLLEIVSIEDVVGITEIENPVTFQEFRDWVYYHTPFDKEHVFVNRFWTVVDSLTEVQRKHFLFFMTGSGQLSQFEKIMIRYVGLDFEVGLSKPRVQGFTLRVRYGQSESELERDLLRSIKG
jgi:hypothetical protein